MKKLIMVLAMICMIGSIALGMMNKTFLEETKDDLKNTKKEVREVREELGKEEEKRDGLRADESNARDLKNMASAALDASKQTLKIEQRKVCLLYTSPSPRDS